MKKLLLIVSATFVLLTGSSLALASNGHGAAVDVAHYDTSNKASLQNGFKLFVNYCLSCHSAGYARYNQVSEDLDIPLSLLKENLMYISEKEGDLMKSTMSEADAKKWFGVTPPDLTLVSRVRKPNWVYTYLRAFYQDENSASGWNNSLFDHVAMPHVLYELQGVQQLVGKVAEGDHAAEGSSHADAEGSSHADAEGSSHAADGEADAHAAKTRIVGDSIFELSQPGKLTPDEFDSEMLDLTNFLVYLAEPAIIKRQSIGVFTLAFLLLLTILCYLLKLEFWRDVH